MEEPLLAPIVADEAESAIPDQSLNRAVRHVAAPPRAVAGRPWWRCIKLRSTSGAPSATGDDYLNKRFHMERGLSSPVAG